MIPKGSRIIATYIYDNPNSKYVKKINVYATGDLHTGNGMNFFYRDGITDGYPFDPIEQKRMAHPDEGYECCLTFEELGDYYECFVDINGPDILKFALTETDLERCMRDGS